MKTEGLWTSTQRGNFQSSAWYGHEYFLELLMKLRVHVLAKNVLKFNTYGTCIPMRTENHFLIIFLKNNKKLIVVIILMNTVTHNTNIVILTFFWKSSTALSKLVSLSSYFFIASWKPSFTNSRA